ncbi:MAG: hypothetical protein HY077_03010 [Elusimicrobia bacterium]|nr:hypothetical protein [Elusimicrobiota bacterium]
MLKRHLAPIGLGLLLACNGLVCAANLDVTAAYRMRAISYSNLELNLDNRNNHQYLSNDARLGMAVRKIFLETKRGEETTMDVSLLLRALGTAGSTTTLAIPLNGAANFYPSVDMTPFLENAYLRVHNLFGVPATTTLGRQSFKLGSGLLLDDDGAGLTGVAIDADLPFWGAKAEAFLFGDRNSRYAPANSLDLFGAAFDLPTEGTWQLSQLFERDRAIQPVYGCNRDDVNPDINNGPRSCSISKAVRSFSSLHYQISYGPIVFDGEAAMERGSATPTGARPARNHITYTGDAQVVKAKWKQHVPGLSADSYLRLSVARASGDNQATSTRDEAFFPSHGHRFDGLERTGFGDFFAATPYDAFGGNYSTNTASGLRQGASGIIVVGGGLTPPAFKGVILDVDFFLFQADRIQSGPRTLGTEWDVRLRYPILDHFSLSTSVAVFTAGTASNPARGTSKKWSFEASGRF